MHHKDTYKSHWHLNEGDFFNGLPETTKTAFFARATRREIARKQFLFFEEAPGTTCFYLESGAVRIFRFTSMGKEPIMFIRKAGEMFGLAEIIDTQNRKCNAQAMNKSVVYVINKKNFEQLLSEHPAFARRVIATMGRRIRYLGEQVENLMEGNVSTRLMKVLTYLSFEVIRKTAKNNAPVDVPYIFSQAEFASMIGSCQQTISETLKQFQSQSLIKIHNRKILLLNPHKLVELLYGE